MKEILDILRNKENFNVGNGDYEITLYKYQIDKILDYITNLQEENERLKNGYCELKVKCNNGECDCTNEEYDGMVQANMKNYLLLEDYKSRIDKAIEYMKTLWDEYATNDYDIKCEVFKKLYYDILQGEDTK